MKLSHPIGWLVFGIGLGGFTMLFGPQLVVSGPAPAWAGAEIRATDANPIFPDACSSSNEQDDTEIVIKGIGNSGNHFTFGRSNGSGHVFADVAVIPPVSDRTLQSIFDAVRRSAQQGDAEAARLIAEIALAQRKSEAQDDDNDDEGEEYERQ